MSYSTQRICSPASYILLLGGYHQLPPTLPFPPHIPREPHPIHPQRPILLAVTRASRLHVIRIRPALRNRITLSVNPGPDDAAAKGPVAGCVADVAAGEGIVEGAYIEEVGVGSR